MIRHYAAVAFRNLRSAPLATAINVLSLAVGLVCFVTAYAFVTFWDSAEQSFSKSADVYVLTTTIRNRDGAFGITDSTRAPERAAEALRSDYPSLAHVALAAVIDRETMVASEGRAERMCGVAVDREFLELFDFDYVAGDSPSALTAPRSVVLTRAAAVRLYGAGADEAIGKPIVIGNRIDATVTAVVADVAEPSHLGRSANAALPFDLLASRDVLEALRASASGGAPPAAADWFFLGASIVYLYLPPGGAPSAAALAPQLDDFVARHVPAEMRKNLDYRFGLLPVRRMLSGTGDYFGTGLSRASALLLLAALVLGVACVNYANLATARAARRVREIGVRKALGASPSQIAVQSLFDAAATAALALCVALAAFVLAQPLVRTLLGANVGPTFFASLAVWPSLAVLAAVVSLAAGAYPALVLSRVRPVAALAAAQARTGSAALRTVLVGCQFGIASFLLIALSAMTAQNAALRRTALAAVADPLVLIQNPTAQTKVAPSSLRERLAAVPAVRGVTEIRYAPYEFLLTTSVAASPDPTAAQRTVAVREVGFDFFAVFDVPILAGRAFDREHADDAAPAPGSADAARPVDVVVDRQLAADLGFTTPADAVDRLLYPPPSQNGPPQPPLRIVGVAESRMFTWFRATRALRGTIYRLRADLELTVARVAAAELGAGVAGIDSAWKDLAPNVAISRRFSDEVFERAYTFYTQTSRLFGVLAVMAFAICVAGLFGMATFVTGRRRREMGVRKTLGAGSAQLATLLVIGFSRPVLAANLIAWPAGYFAARAYLNQFAEPIRIEPWPFVLSLLVTLAIACVAVAGQTLRAAATKPAEALRHE